MAVAVTWTNTVFVNTNGSSISKSTGGAAWNAGAVSNESFTGDGYVQFSTSENDTAKMGGLSNGDADQSYTDIDFAFYLAANGQAYVYEGGVYRASVGPYVANDVFRVAVVSGEVRYYINGQQVYTSGGTPTEPLVLDTSIYTGNATITNGDVTVGAPPTFWQNLVGVNEGAMSITKTGASGWNAGASSQGTINETGYAQFSPGATNTAQMAGLSNGDTDTSYQDIDFAVYMAANGSFFIFEGGASRGSFGTYQAGDTFRVSVSAAGTVTYSRNGTVFYTSTGTPTFPLRVDTSQFTPGAVLNSVSIARFWQNIVGVSTAGAGLTKTGAVGWNAGASSSVSIAGDGYMEFTTAETNTYKMAGLSNGDTDQNYTDIDYAVYLGGGGNVYVYENGAYRGVFGTYNVGDVFRVQVVSGVVTYYRNGLLFYTSGGTPTSPLRVDTALFTNGATINGVTIADGTPTVGWQNLANVSVNGSSLTKTVYTGWNGGASTTNTIAANGYVEFTTAEANTAKMAGLSNGDTDASYQDIDFAFYLGANGVVYIYEGGALRATIGAYQAGDTFRVQNTGGTITYLQNANVVYTSGGTPTSPLRLDTSLFTIGATINNVTLVPTM
ncbi:MAG: hypothetical protein KC503_29620 [Myxococcales bacterium]|nr:hypothetical protein [Myxococcales bacterium]